MSQVTLGASTLKYGDNTLQTYPPWKKSMAWTDLSGSRVLGTYYTVPATTPVRWVSVVAVTSNPGLNNLTIAAYIGTGVLTQYRISYSANNGYGNGVYFSVPPGLPYTVTASELAGYTPSIYWYEMS